jgi:2,3-bisphosphoglycerate-independent phosphoglycerate mutase
MANVTHLQFMNFLDDIEAAISKDPGRGNLDDEAYKVMDTWVSDVSIIDTEETDEVFDSGDFKDREAVIEIIVEYLYIPDLLSGT